MLFAATTLLPAIPAILPLLTLLVLYVYHTAIRKVTEKYTSEWGAAPHIPVTQEKLSDGSQEEEMSSYVKNEYKNLGWKTNCNQNNETCYVN